MLPSPFSYVGSKFYLREFILPHINHSGRIYVEPFCGSANIFFAKVPHAVEVLNDLNGHIVNFFRVLQDRRQFRHFAHRVRWTPYSVEEYRLACAVLDTPITSPLEHAWAFFVCGSMGFSGTRSGWRRSFEGGIPNVHWHWQERIRGLEAWRDRLLNVQIDHKPALDMIDAWDTTDTVFYLDPPYVTGTRITTDAYTYEMTDADHLALVQRILTVQGRVVLSGYDSPLYTVLEREGWTRIEKVIASRMAWERIDPEKAGTRGNRTEVLWVNRAGAEPSLWAPRVEVIQQVEPVAVPVLTGAEQGTLW